MTEDKTGFLSHETHFQALCNFIENEKVDRVKEILDKLSPEYYMAVNRDGFTPLDLSILINSKEIWKALTSVGGRQGVSLMDSSHFDSLISETKKQIDKFGQLLKVSSLNSSLSLSQIKECEKQMSLWTLKSSALKRMKNTWEFLRVPESPKSLQTIITSSESVTILIEEPSPLRTLYTKVKVQWTSESSSFDYSVHEKESFDLRSRPKLQLSLSQLLEGQRIFIRVSFGNYKGYGATMETSTIPSSWTSLDENERRISNQFEICTNLLSQLSDSEEGFESSEVSRDKKTKKFLQIFSERSHVKFQRRLLGKKIYLTIVIYHDDKVLLTTEDVLPLLDIDDLTSSSISSEFLWFSKVTLHWSDLEKFKSKMTEGSSSFYNSHLRSKLLNGALALQNSLGLQNLGKLYYKPLSTADGSLLLCLVHRVDTLRIGGLSFKWTSLSKTTLGVSGVNTGNNTGTNTSRKSSIDILHSSIPMLMLFHQVSSIPLSKGLYVLYLMGRSTLESLSVFVPTSSPSILPYNKVRDSPHVSSQEWEMIRYFNCPSPNTTNFLAGEGEDESSEIFSQKSLPSLLNTSTQFSFGKEILEATTRLFDDLNIDKALRSHHRLYDKEILTLSPDVSCLLILPSVSSVISLSSTNSPYWERNDLVPLPLQVFELLHLWTYEEKLLSVYSRLTILLEISLVEAKQRSREAFSTQETLTASKTLKELSSFQRTLEESWKRSRWLVEILYLARDKSVGISLSSLSTWLSAIQSRLRERKDFSPLPSSTENLFGLQEQNVLRIYAAYDTGLRAGTSVRIRVSLFTTSREVIDLVVRELNNALRGKGIENGPFYDEESLGKFCLVAVIGSRERCLRDDFIPLKLQNPWKKGKLLIRLRNDLLTPNEQSCKHSTVL